jgi:exodeoxyribonuclease VII small subunit
MGFSFPATARGVKRSRSRDFSVFRSYGPRVPDPSGPGDPGFDAILVRLREVVTRLESGELSLEQSLAVYEEGVALARKGQQLLASAEKRVEILVSASGGIETVPFEEPGS